MGKERADKELEVFHLFAQASGLSISEGSVEKRRPPEPDILFYDLHSGPRAFELVELLNEDFARMTGLVTGTKTALYSFYEELPQDKKLLFARKYHNTLLCFRFSRTVTFNQRKSCLPDIFFKLITLPDEFTGEALEKDTDLKDRLKGILSPEIFSMAPSSTRKR